MNQELRDAMRMFGEDQWDEKCLLIIADDHAALHDTTPVTDANIESLGFDKRVNESTGAIWWEFGWWDLTRLENGNYTLSCSYTASIEDVAMGQVRLIVRAYRFMDNL